MSVSFSLCGLCVVDPDHDVVRVYISLCGLCVSDPNNDAVRVYISLCGLCVLDSDSDNDGICDEFEIYGCTDVNACNYNSSQTIDQDKMIEGYGGIEAAGKLGASGATPPPK